MMPKLWERTFVGGGVAVQKLATKDARIDMVRLSLLDNSYFRRAFRGVIAAGTEMFCRRCFVNELPKRGDIMSFKVSWA